MGNMLNSAMISRALPWFLIAVAVIALGTAYTAQLGFGYDPCVLCLYQRVPYAFIAGLGALAFLVPEAGKRRWIAFLAAFIFLTGAGIAFYHVGVEQNWWQSVAPCGVGGPAVTSTEDLFKQLQQKPEKSCGDIDWVLFGISMATYNAVVSVILAFAMLVAWLRLDKGDDA